MAKDRMFFLLSFAVLGLIAAFLFRKSDIPAPPSPAKMERAAEKTVATIEDEVNKPKEGFVLRTAPGKRAVGLELNARSAMAQFMSPGMFVDLTFNSKSDIGFGTISVTLIRNVRILAIGKDSNGKTYDENGGYYKSNSPIEVLLEMTPKQAEIFFFATTAGEISIGLANTKSSVKENELVTLLMQSESAGNFRSILVTYMMRNLFPNVPITITSTSKGYIVSGVVRDPQIANKILEILVKLAPGGEASIVNLMEVEPQQVMICVKVFEVASRRLSRLGLNWKAVLDHNGASLAFGAFFPPPVPSDPTYFLKVAGVQWGDFSLSALVDLLEEDIGAYIIAEPNLTTISGQTAHFFAGGEFPILIPQGGNLIGTVTVDFKPYGVLLEFTPIVDLNGLITLHVVPEVSNLDKQNSVVLNGFVIPALVKRRADTVVKLWPGQSYILGGLLQDELSNRNEGIWGLNRMPLIGPLFRSEIDEDRRTELMILITPFLVHTDRPETIRQIECNPNACSSFSCDLEYSSGFSCDPCKPPYSWRDCDCTTDFNLNAETYPPCEGNYCDGEIETITQWEVPCEVDYINCEVETIMHWEAQ